MLTKYRTISLWPYLKLRFYSDLSELGTATKDTSLPQTRSRSKLRLFFKLKLDTYKKKKKINSLAKQLSQELGIIDGVLFFSLASHCEAKKDSITNKFLTPIANSMNIKEIPRFLLWNQANYILSPQATVSCTLFNKYLDEVASVASTQLDDPQLIGLIDKAERLIAEKSAILRLNTGEAYKDIRTLYLLSFFFNKLFCYSKIKKVFLCCYYNIPSFAICHAANTHGISSIEVQHGQQGDLHPFYSNWTNYPRKSYTLLPSTFWVWGTLSAKRIMKWAKEKHKIVIGGNPSLLDKSFEKYLLSLPQQKVKKILISSQIKVPLPEFLYEAISERLDITWTFRLHPKEEVDFNDVREMLITRLGLERNWTIELSSSSNYLDSVCNHDLHITGWSTTAYEALNAGVHSIIIHKTGLVTMQDYIKEKVFGYADNKSDLFDIIDNPSFNKPSEPYMKSDRETFQKAIEEIAT